MVATWLIVGGVVALLGAGSAGIAYFAGKSRALQAVAESSVPTGGTGFFTWLSNLIFGDSIKSMFNEVIVYVIIAVVIFFVIRYFTNRRKRTKIIKYKHSGEHHNRNTYKWET